MPNGNAPNGRGRSTGRTPHRGRRVTRRVSHAGAAASGAADVKPRRVTEIRRPRYLADFGTACFQTRFVSNGSTNTAPFVASKSRVSFAPPRPRVRRNTRVSPNETVTIGAPGTMSFVL